MSFESDLLRDSTARLFVDLFDRPSLDARPKPESIGTVWTAFEEAGLPLAAVPEALGGVGATLGDAMALVCLCGAHAVPAPLAETIMAGWIWSVGAKSAPPDGPLTIAAGQMISAAHLRPSSSGWTIGATLARVPWARQAKSVLFEADHEGRRVLVCAPLSAAKITAGSNMALEPRDTVQFEAAALAASCVVAADAACSSSRIHEVFALTRAAQLSGAMATALDRTIVYANERIQFGKPIGKFQAVQHQLAMAAGEAAAAQAAVDLAVALADDAGRFALASAAAKARASEAAGVLASVCHQTHAAIGFTNEHPLQLYTRRLWAWRDEAGAETYWHRVIGERLLAEPPQDVWPLLTTLTPTA